MVVFITNFVKKQPSSNNDITKLVIEIRDFNEPNIFFLFCRKKVYGDVL